MTISFFEPGEIPQPREKVKLELLSAEPLADRWRVKINIHVTPFIERPNLAVVLLREDGVVVGEMSIIETMHNKMEFTLHIRYVEDPAGDFRLKVRLYYENILEPADESQTAFHIVHETL